MKHELKKIENSAVEVKIELTAEELSPIKSNVVKKVAENAEVPGFRKGKAPVAKVEAEYSDAINQEVVSEVLNSEFTKVVEAEKINPISYIYDLTTDMKDGLTMTFKVDVYPEVTLGAYKGVEVEKETFEMSDDILNKEIDNMLTYRAKLVDAPEGYKAQMGDVVDLAFEGFIDGVAFEGGKSDSHQLKLGTKSFIDTFEDQLVGYTAGQEGEVNVTFPAEYHVADLAGKPAVFKVKVNAIKLSEKPELNEELVKEFGFEKVEDFKNKMREDIKNREEARVKNEYVGKLLQKIVADSKFEVPRSMVAREVENRVAEMEQQISMQGITLDQYLSMTGMTREQLFNQIAPSAHNKVQIDLVLGAVVKAENITVTDEELEKRTEEVAKMYNMTKEQLVGELTKNNNLDNFKASLRNELVAQKAVDFIVENAK